MFPLKYGNMHLVTISKSTAWSHIGIHIFLLMKSSQVPDQMSVSTGYLYPESIEHYSQEN